MGLGETVECALVLAEVVKNEWAACIEESVAHIYISFKEAKVPRYKVREILFLSPISTHKS